MRLTICFLFIQNIFYNKAMVGENVRRAVDQEFPYIVSIKVINNLNREPESDHGCVGIILSPKDILTVAHCLDGVLMIKIEIIVGSVDIRQGTKYQPNEFITYNSWAKNNNKALIQTDNDIAVLKICQAISSTITPAILNFTPVSNLYGQNVVTVGWGRTITGKKSRYLETVTLKVLSANECKTRIDKLTKKRFFLNPKYVCTAAQPFAFLRKGDSGGPLLLNGKLVGINKASAPLREDQFNPQKVNIHVSTTYYKKFILDTVFNCSYEL